MTDERFEELLESLRKLGPVTVTNEPLWQEMAGGAEEVGNQDVVLFARGNEQFKLVRENRPLVLGKTMTYSHRAGDTARTEYQLSDTEFSHKVRVFRELDIDEWEEISADNLSI